MDKQYCPICGKRIVPLMKGQLQYRVDFGTFTVNCYITTSNSTEPICFGHPDTPLPIGTAKDLQRVKVPQAFYAAFSNEEDLL